MEQTVKCPVCGRPYKVYSHYAGDQSACRKCRNEAERLERGTDFREFPQESQQEYFGNK